MKTSPKIIITSLFLAVCALPMASAQTLLLDYKFNGADSATTLNAGTLAGSTLVYHNNNKQEQNLYSGPGTGVSGAIGDTALNNRSAGGMGTIANNAAGASTATRSANIGTLGSFTVSGWFWADSTPGSAAKLFELYGGANAANSITVIAEGGNRLAVSIGGSSSGKNSTQQTGYSKTGEWVFWAVTYDGTSTSNNLAFYLGSTDLSSNLVLAGTRSVDFGAINFGSEVGIGIGNGYYNNGNANRPFNGLVDNVQLYGAGAGSALGALDVTQINGLRQQAIPEASSVVLVLGASALAVVGWKRRSSILKNSAAK